jgi:integrase/recombinase XerD
MSQARVLNESEVKKVLKVISFRRHSNRDRAIFLLGLYSGLRAKELASLRICDVLNSDAEVKDTVYLSSDQTKGRKGRAVIFGTKARQEVTKYLLHRFNTKDLKPILLTDTTRPLFSTQKNPRQGFSPNTLAGHFCNLMREAKIEHGSSHSMRRSFITSLADKGVSVRVLQELAGHANLATTARYIAVNDAVMRRAVELV